MREHRTRAQLLSRCPSQAHRTRAQLLSRRPSQAHWVQWHRLPRPAVGSQ